MSVSAAFAADSPKAATKSTDTKAADTMKAEGKLEKPANVSAADWAKMTDADKKKAVEKAKAEEKGKTNGTMKSSEKSAAAPKKEKKGGC